MHYHPRPRSRGLGHRGCSSHGAVLLLSLRKWLHWPPGWVRYFLTSNDTLCEMLIAHIGTFCAIHCSCLWAVIPGTKCQVYHSCSGGEPTNINQCGDGLWYDPKVDHCEAQIQGVPIDCPPDPACPTPSPRSPTSRSPEFASLTEIQGEKTTGKIVWNSLTFLFWWMKLIGKYGKQPFSSDTDWEPYFLS